MRETTFGCPHCGASLPTSARFCKHCGSSDSDGWNDSYEAEVDDDFDYDEFVDREFSSGRVSTRLHPVWKITAVLLLLGFLLMLLQL